MKKNMGSSTKLHRGPHEKEGNSFKDSAIKDTLYHFKNYLGSDAIIAILSFLMIPVLTRLLTVSEYGIFNVFISYISIFTILIFLNAHASVGRYFFECNSDFNEFVGTTIIFSVVILLLSSILLIVCLKQVSYYLDLPAELIILLLFLAAIGMLESVIRQIYQANLMSRENAIIFTLKSITTFIIAVVITYYYFRGEKYYGPIYARVIVGGIFFCYFLAKLKDYFSLAFKFKHIYYIISYSFPLIPYALSSVILSHFDRIMVNSYMGSMDAGLYSLAYNIGMLLSLVVGALNSAFYPKFFNYYRQKEYQAHDFEVLEYHRSILSIALILVVFSHEIGLVLAPKEYLPALRVTPIVVVGYIFYSMFVIYNRNIDYSKRTIYSSGIMLSAGLVNILLNSFCIPIWGYIAAAYTTLISYLLLALLSWTVSKYLIKMHSPSIVKMILPIICLIPVAIVTFWIESVCNNLGFLIFFKIVMICASIFMLFYQRFRLVFFQ